MKCTAFAGVLAMTATIALAQTNPQDHETHHPEGAASAAAPSAPAPTAQAVTPDKVERQMQMMQDMHKRMQAARTPVERQALMAEHMKVMQSGMEMMSQMGPGSGRTEMGGMAAGPGGAAPGSQPNQMGPAGMGGMNGMLAMHGSMERRMAMMEQMMQMLVDRAAAGQH